MKKIKSLLGVAKRYMLSAATFAMTVGTALGWNVDSIQQIIEFLQTNPFLATIPAVAVAATTQIAQETDVKKQPYSVRNNNPGNIETSRTDRNSWKGEVLPNPQRFAKFQSKTYGCRAMLYLLQVYHTRYGLNTVHDIINRWCPPAEGVTEFNNYVTFVCAQLRVQPDTTLAMDKRDTIAIAKAMSQVETGYPYPVTESTWEEAWELL